MFGAYGRAAMTVPVAAVVAGVLEFVFPFFLPYLGPEDGLLYRSFDWLSANALMLLLAAIAAGVLAAAYIESNPGVRR